MGFDQCSFWQMLADGCFRIECLRAQDDGVEGEDEDEEEEEEKFRWER